MPVFRIKNKSAEENTKKNSSRPSPKDLGLPTLGKPPKPSRISTILAFAGFFVSIGGLGLYINESKAGQKNEAKQYVLHLSVVDSLKQPVPGASLKSLQRPIGVTNTSGQWKKTFAIVAGSEYPIAVEGKDNQGRLEVKHVKLVFPHWTKSSSVMNRLIRLDTLKSEIPINSETVTSTVTATGSRSTSNAGAVEGSATPISENSSKQDLNKLSQVSQKPNPTSVSQNAMPIAPTSALGPTTSAVSSAPLTNPSGGVALPTVAPSQGVTGNLQAAGPSIQKPAPANPNVASGNQNQLPGKESSSVGKHPGILPKELSKIWIRTEGASSTNPQIRSQSLEAVKEKLQTRTKSLGFVLDEKAPLTLSLKNLDGKLGNEAQDVIQVDVQFAGKPMETFLRNYQEDALTTARLILWRARLSLPVSYQAKKEGDRIVAMQPLEGPELWRLSEGVKLSDSGGKIAVVSKETSKALSVPLAASTGFCNASACRTQLRPGEISQIGWSKRTLTVLGANGRNLKIFAAGTMATAIQGGYSYEGQDNGFTVFTVIEDGKIIYRNALHNNLYQQTILTLPVSSISSR